MTTKDLIDLSKLTNGRISDRTVFIDFVALCAMAISCAVDCVHADARRKGIAEILTRYQPKEHSQLFTGFRDLTDAVKTDIEQQRWEDRLGNAFQKLGMSGKDGIDFTPPDLTRLMARITMGATPTLPPEGYFTVTDPTCGSGITLLAAAEQLADAGYNPCQHLVMQAADLNRTCAHMAYVNLSLYGIPAVVIHGNTLTMEEYSRWYTPAYVLGNWIWRCPLPYGSSRNRSDELLKMATDPLYAAIRKLQKLELGSAS